MLEKSCTEFLNLLSTKEPVPGGGGASAYVGALGMALGSMVGNLTLGKKKYQDVEEEIKELLVKSEAVMIELIKLVDKDAEAFFPLSQAYGLPKNTDEERQKGKEFCRLRLWGQPWFRWILQEAAARRWTFSRNTD